MPYFQYNKINIFFDDKGTGIPLVFIHPPGMGRKVFYHQYSLSKHFRILTPDLSGHGDTSGALEHVTMKNFASEIRALLDHLSIAKAVICGYSSGGCVAQEFALSYQDRTLGLILAGGFPEIRSAVLRYEHQIGMYFIKNFPSAIKFAIAAAHTLEPNLRNMLKEHMDQANRKVWFDFYNRSLHFSCVDRLPQLKIPLLLIYGAKDFTNQHIRAYRRVTSFQAAFIKKAHHQLPFKNWQLFNQIITGFVVDHFSTDEQS
ncbi:alpha/beta hydrolase [Bacillus aquiflavi]|uniref:Alpha/beta hydrolase n=1 Tax=Bacillus aquiflavi TaxID=2672567 RepID=A0A6B3W4N5_9BACI|nr:alpha/beta hydrolase [Bacillus aquiflavi]MBA4537149.1 alpha/beta hydrolase [Bacillus aquiflavi]NEY82424.1 alpha/beta hydrolase [Bacillus aquiflavi]UAC49773.1 alpha/beta hydrolase [Bacillus aquiflavi]